MCLVYHIFQCDNCSANSTDGKPQYEVVSIESQSDLDRKKAGMMLTLSPTKIPPENIHTPQEDGEDGGKWCTMICYNSCMNCQMCGTIIHHSLFP